MKATHCSVDGCDRHELARGLCGMHYQRFHLTGTTDLIPRYLPSVERLHSGLERKANGCLEWTGCDDGKGYGVIRFNGKSGRTHRFAWELANGPIPDGMAVLHHCDNPPCCETEPSEAYPDGHLFLGTTADNTADMMAKGRNRQGVLNRAKTHCIRDHPYDEANTYTDRRGWRACRICKSAANVRRRRRKCEVSLVPSE